MIALLQRVREASVEVDGEVVGAIGLGLVALVGCETGDEPADGDFLARKTVEIRIFHDDEGKMNRSVEDVGGGILAISQFTLLGDARKGRRPSFVKAAPPDVARPLFEGFVEAVRSRGVPVETGVFGARMLVRIENEGPVTIILESPRGPGSASGAGGRGSR